MYHITYVIDKRNGNITNAASLERAIYKRDINFELVGKLQPPQNNFESYLEGDFWVVGRFLYGKFVETGRYRKI